MKKLVRTGLMLILLCAFLQPDAAFSKEDVAPLSTESQMCIGCHASVTPGIVSDWKNSRMAKTTPGRAKEKPDLEKRVSFENMRKELADVVIGCAECHTMNPEKHEDTFDHAGVRVHPVVTPGDCAACHPAERKEFSENIMAEAHGNLEDNPLYGALVTAAAGSLKFSDMKLEQKEPSDDTKADSCLFCHGTKLKVKKTAGRETDMGPMEFPVIQGWPNQGVGRINPDNSKGSCSACHPRHRFSIETARKPETCSQCHKGPDVPAYKVYSVSKHGNIYNSQKNSDKWDFASVPWKVGKDMEAPTCAACHISLLTTEDGTPLAQRTHRMNDRLAWRIFGLPYAHAHPQSPDTSKIVNKDGLALPTALDSTPARDFLISENTMNKREETMQQVCRGCHSSGWIKGHFSRLESTIEETNAQTLTATKILQEAWEKGAAKGPSENKSPFDEAIERMWAETWLFYANSTRFASAMGGADYGVFAQGRWYLTGNITLMVKLLELKTDLKQKD
ncbi:MAG: hydroxylamine oxidase [Desulfobacteraceae bacterium]|nr:hydroxylamine oxidase [Desulfobacteraceae bacterium]